MLLRIGRPAGLVALSLVLAACDPKAGSDEEDGDAASNADASNGDSSSGATEVGCAAETRDDEYMLGMEKTGTALRVRFVEALPAPPDRGDNTWTIEVLDLATGEPAEGMSLVVEPYMPDHMHGTSIACAVTEMPMPGELKLEPVNLFMPGLWEVRLHFTLADASTDELQFSFCVDP